MRWQWDEGFFPQVLERRVHSVSAPEVVSTLSLAACPEIRPSHCCNPIFTGDIDQILKKAYKLQNS
jgi:hypothetical protein